MQQSTRLLLTFAALSATASTLFAQNAYMSGAGNPNYTQSQPAPIERSNDALGQSGPTTLPPLPAIITATPAPGVLVRTDRPNAVQTVSADANRVELRLDHGRANISVHDPAPNTLVLVDLPGGQTQLVKNGFYTFNADTNTVRVLSGEAKAFAGANSEKPIKVKGDYQVVFAGAQTHSSYSDPYYTRQDVVGYGYAAPGTPVYGSAPVPVYAYAPYGYGPYGDGYYGGYPYYAYGYPYGWGYPYGIGFGFGYGGGFYRGGYGSFRGGYGGGFHGGGRR
jgi:hypothetical protein